jgi:enamine deaminase RidA (YjgF/YER057c/UK114 family)
MTLPHDVAGQTRSIFRTVEKALLEAGSSMSRIVRCQYFVIDADYCEPVLKVCGEVLRDIRPAAGIYVVSGLLKPEMKVEIEVTARVG